MIWRTYLFWLFSRTITTIVIKFSPPQPPHQCYFDYVEMDRSNRNQQQDQNTRPMDVGMAAPNAQPSTFAVPIPQHPLGYASPGHSQQGPYSHMMSYGPPAYHSALPMQYGYASSMGGHPHYGQPAASWTPTPIPVPVPYTDTTPPVGSPVDHGRSTEGEGRVNTSSRV